MASAFRILGEGQLSLTKFLLRDRSPRRSAELQGDARASPRADASGDRSLRLLEPVDGHARLHGTGGEPGVERRLARPGRSGARAAAAVHGVRAARRDATCGCSARAVWSSEAHRAPSIRTRRRVSPADAAFRDWPLVVLTEEPARAAASSMNFLWTTFTRFEPAADIHAAERRIVRNHIAYSAPIVIDARLKPGFPKELSCDEDDGAHGDAQVEGIFSVDERSRWAIRRKRRSRLRFSQGRLQRLVQRVRNGERERCDDGVEPVAAAR